VSAAVSHWRRGKLTILVVVAHVGLLLVDGEAGRLDGLFSNFEGLLVSGAGAGSVDGFLVDGVLVPGGYGNFLAVVGSEALAVFTLGNVNWAGVVRLAMINLDASVGVFGMRPDGEKMVSSSRNDRIFVVLSSQQMMVRLQRQSSTAS
jgi:hypothetical protein